MNEYYSEFTLMLVSMMVVFYDPTLIPVDCIDVSISLLDEQKFTRIKNNDLHTTSHSWLFLHTFYFEFGIF